MDGFPSQKDLTRLMRDPVRRWIEWNARSYYVSIILNLKPKQVSGEKFTNELPD